MGSLVEIQKLRIIDRHVNGYFRRILDSSLSKSEAYEFLNFAGALELNQDARDLKA